MPYLVHMVMGVRGKFSRGYKALYNFPGPTASMCNQPRSTQPGHPSVGRPIE